MKGKKQILFSFLLLLVASCFAVTSLFAWFLNFNTPSVEGVDLPVVQGEHNYITSIKAHSKVGNTWQEVNSMTQYSMLTECVTIIEIVYSVPTEDVYQLRIFGSDRQVEASGKDQFTAGISSAVKFVYDSSKTFEVLKENAASIFDNSTERKQALNEATEASFTITLTGTGSLFLVCDYDDTLISNVYASVGNMGGGLSAEVTFVGDLSLLLEEVVSV